MKDNKILLQYKEIFPTKIYNLENEGRNTYEY